MNKHAILHIPDSAYAHALSETRIVLRLRAAKGDLQQCVLFYGNRVHPEHKVRMHSLDMKRVASDRLYDYFEADFETDMDRLCYYFWLSDGKEDFFYYSGEFTNKPTVNRSEYYHFPFVRREDIPDVPVWAKDAILYQIFPDSFATAHRFISCLKNDRMTDDGERCESQLGGTIRGIIENMDYIKDLGINCLYLNPIFSAGAYHKYDSIDYYSIDPCFGTFEDFKEMVSICHDHGIRVILDGVFNHCGWMFFAFKDVLEKGEQSAYKDWFYKLEFPVDTKKVNYAAFAYVKQMPKLNTGNPQVVRYFCDVGRFWIHEAGIDGWRLDVANEVNHDFWRAFRKAVREEKPDALLIAEIWEDAEQWLQGDQFDSAMNYRFTDICKAFFAYNEISVDDFDAQLNYMLMRYKKQITQIQMNMLDSHDVPRFLSHCGEDLEKLKLAALFEMTYVGVPSIYSGDEKAIKGMIEADYRSPMVWQDTKETQKLTAYYQKLISLRKENIAIFNGDVKTILKDSAKGVYIFSRFKGDEEILVALNNSPYEQAVQIPDPYGDHRMDLLADKKIRRKATGLEIKLLPYGGAVLARLKKTDNRLVCSER